MISSQYLEADLLDSLAQLASVPLAEVLLQHGVLRSLAVDHLRRRLIEGVVFSPEEEKLVIARLWQGTAAEPPTTLAPGWIDALPEMLRGPMRDRWDQIRLQKWMEQTYRDQVEPYFLERRDDLEQVVYGMIRLRHQGAAEELYLRLLDDDADFGELARNHSLGEERYTRGLVGPMRISQPHPTIRAVLQNLSVGELHPPFSVDNWILLVRMEHRKPAQLTDSLLLQLNQELLQRDLDALLDARLPELYPGLVDAWPGQAPRPVVPPDLAVPDQLLSLAVPAEPFPASVIAVADGSPPAAASNPAPVVAAPATDSDSVQTASVSGETAALAAAEQPTSTSSQDPGAVTVAAAHAHAEIAGPPPAPLNPVPGVAGSAAEPAPVPTASVGGEAAAPATAELGTTFSAEHDAAAVVGTDHQPVAADKEETPDLAVSAPAETSRPADRGTEPPAQSTAAI